MAFPVRSKLLFLLCKIWGFQYREYKKRSAENDMVELRKMVSTFRRYLQTSLPMKMSTLNGNRVFPMLAPVYLITRRHISEANAPSTTVSQAPVTLTAMPRSGLLGCQNIFSKLFLLCSFIMRASKLKPS